MSKVTRNWIKPSFVLLTLDNETTEQDKAALKATGLSFKQVEGYYNGQSEISYLVIFKHVEDLQTLAAIARNHDQESILVVDNERNSKLVYLDGRVDDRVDMGVFKNVPEYEAKMSLSYTYDQCMDSYYLTV